MSLHVNGVIKHFLFSKSRDAKRKTFQTSCRAKEESDSTYVFDIYFEVVTT